MPRDIFPIYPGEHLAEFPGEYGVSAYRLAKCTSLSQNQVSHILRGKWAVTAYTALRLERFFSMSPQFWLNLQGRYDLETAQGRLADWLEHEVEPLKVA